MGQALYRDNATLSHFDLFSYGYCLRKVIMVYCLSFFLSPSLSVCTCILSQFNCLETERLLPDTGNFIYSLCNVCMSVYVSICQYMYRRVCSIVVFPFYFLSLICLALLLIS